MINILKKYVSPRMSAAFFLGVLTAFGLGLWAGDHEPPPPPAAKFQLAGEPMHEKEEITRYACPMMCTPPMEAPGDCPICGMKLHPIIVENHRHDGPARLSLSPEAAKLAQVRLASVERKFVSAEVRLFGRIDYDPAHTTVISAFMPGVIDRVYVKRAGQFVRWGDPLFDIYSSDLLETQKQLIDAMRYVPSFLAFQAGTPHVARDMPVIDRERSSGSEEDSLEQEKALRTISAIRHKLSILGLPKRDIDQMMKVGEATGIATVYASMYGQISEQNAFEGTYVNTGTPIFTIADPRYVWVSLDAYETDYPWIRKGQPVTFEVDAYPGETFSAKVVYVDPVFNARTRTFSIGAISNDDRGGRMKAGMTARAVIHAALAEDGSLADENTPPEKAPLVIPSTAPLITGKRAVVYAAVPDEEGAFEGREVRLGPKAGNYYVLKGGLSEGERVVVNGNFKIDSAVQILATGGMMTLPGNQLATAHQHPGGSEEMHEDYVRERTKSRMTREEPSMDAHTGRRWNRHGTADHGDSSSSVRRRRPGMYGDSTRTIRSYPTTP